MFLCWRFYVPQQISTRYSACETAASQTLFKNKSYVGTYHGLLCQWGTKGHKVMWPGSDITLRLEPCSGCIQSLSEAHTHTPKADLGLHYSMSWLLGRRDFTEARSGQSCQCPALGKMLLVECHPSHSNSGEGSQPSLELVWGTTKPLAHHWCFPWGQGFACLIQAYDLCRPQRVSWIQLEKNLLIGENLLSCLRAQFRAASPISNNHMSLTLYSYYSVQLGFAQLQQGNLFLW